MSETPKTVVFIHGLWLHATSWAPWVGAVRGGRLHDCLAPGWPGIPDTVEAARADPESIADHGIDDVVAHYSAIIDTLPDAADPRRPLLRRHDRGEAARPGQGAAARSPSTRPRSRASCPLPLSSLRSTLPVFKNPANKHRAVSLTAEQFRYSFGNALSDEESQQLFDRVDHPGARAGRCSRRPSANFSLALARGGRHRERGPRAAAAGHGRSGPHGPRGDHEVDAQAVPALRRRHRAPGVRRPRSLADHRQRAGARWPTRCLAWLTEQDLAAAPDRSPVRRPPSLRTARRHGLAASGHDDDVETLVGRERELDRWSPSSLAADERGGGLLLQGPAGIGKSFVLAALSDQGARSTGSTS